MNLMVIHMLGMLNCLSHCLYFFIVMERLHKLCGLLSTSVSKSKWNESELVGI